MIFKKELRKLIIELWLLSLGGWLLHYRVHPIPLPGSPHNPADFLPFTWDLVAILAVPFLLNYRRTVIVGYLINGIGVIIGAVAMASFSIAKPPQPLHLSSIFLATTFPLILILNAKLFIGQIVLLNFYPQGLGRVFTPFWWFRHYVYISVAFAIGHFIWR
jgi:hypothetical protein